MTASGIRREVLAERAAWVRRMCDGLRALPLTDVDTFQADARNVAAAESFLRRALEALLDLGRHVLAKGLGEAVVEYKQIAAELERHGVLDARLASLLREMAGYRNRMVHFYDEVSTPELFEIACTHLPDLEQVLCALLSWAEPRAREALATDAPPAAS